ncbi:hypothetical protein SDC9_189065 [bioreactor metagenome]|uniref:Uncharacterized protein n=1 Tax=bioreactor metagenome TaxID=1076179 RepID=A0A645I1Y4_9ZZZZ
MHRASPAVFSGKAHGNVKKKAGLCAGLSHYAHSARTLFAKKDRPALTGLSPAYRGR